MSVVQDVDELAAQPSLKAFTSQVLGDGYIHVPGGTFPELRNALGRVAEHVRGNGRGKGGGIDPVIGILICRGQVFTDEIRQLRARIAVVVEYITAAFLNTLQRQPTRQSHDGGDLPVASTSLTAAGALLPQCLPRP